MVVRWCVIIASAAGRRQGEKRFKVILGNTETTWQAWAL